MIWRIKLGLAILWGLFTALVIYRNKSLERLYEEAKGYEETRKEVDKAQRPSDANDAREWLRGYSE